MSCRHDDPSPLNSSWVFPKNRVILSPDPVQLSESGTLIWMQYYVITDLIQISPIVAIMPLLAFLLLLIPVTK